MSETYRSKPAWLLYEVTSTLTNGVEVYTRRMDRNFFLKSLPQAAARGPNEVKKLAVWHLYVFRDKPHWTQIIDVSANLQSMEVVVRIQRGHYAITDFVTEHASHSIRTWLNADKFHMRCENCGVNKVLDLISIPSKLPPKIE